MSLPPDAPKPKRRVRYSGTHPKKFSEKYKELDPEKYKAEADKVKARGTTPVGTHRPICVKEIIEILKPSLGETALDATLGYGGHATEIIKLIGPQGRLIGIDQDSVERTKTTQRFLALGITEPVLHIAPINFSGARKYFTDHRIEPVDMILADLGISSMQLDDPTRGFSYKIDAPLDLRMNNQSGETAADLVQRISESDLTDILFDYADEKRARVIAKALIKAKPKTTVQLADAIRVVIKGFPSHIRKEEGDLPIRRAFQALRIAINKELSSLDDFLEDIPHLLKPKGRVAILSFHSGEDRRVKKSFQEFGRLGVYSSVAPELIRPDFDEQKTNPRSKSAKLRWAVRG
ncbi:MAG: 16S rRNA (cytosine(1402)-N(4))-methyltransferase RsmH [Bdellovibrionota bacterium]